MALSNLLRSKGKTVLVVISISISIILLNTILNVTGSFDKETYVQRDTVADFNVCSSSWMKQTDNSEKVISAGTAERLNELDGIEDMGFVYYHPVDFDKESETEQELVQIQEINHKEVSQNPNMFDSSRQIFGYDENILKRVKLIEGKIDYEKLSTGNYVLTAGFLSDKSEYEKEVQEFHEGDQVRVSINGQTKEYTVMAVIGVPSVLMTDYSSGGYESLILSAEQYLKFYPQVRQNPIHCVFDAEDGQFNQLMEYIDAYSSYWNVNVKTKIQAEQEFGGLTKTFEAVGMILALIFGVIGILNLLNVILTSAIARQNEFAVMRSIGMTRKQLRKMFLYEGIFYAILVMFAGVGLSGILSLTVVQAITSGFWFAEYHFTVLPALCASIVCVVLAALISYIVNRIYNKGNIIDNLRKAE